jgi:exosortase/archaeosortase family protein
MDIDFNKLKSNEKLFEASKFVFKLLMAGIVFRMILVLEFDTLLLQEFFASILHEGLSFAGFDFVLSGNEIIADQAVYVIIRDCLGWKSVALFTGLAFASDERIISNLRRFFAGVILLLVANYVRVFTTVVLAESGVLSFEVVHDFLWQWSLALVVLVAWVLWLGDEDFTGYFRERVYSSIDYIKGVKQNLG